MTRIFKLFLIMTLVFGSLKAEAVVYSDSDIKAAISQEVVNIYKNYTDADVSVQVVALPFKDLDLPSGKVSFIVKPSMNKFMARDLEKVFVYVNDKFVKTFNAPVVVKAYQDVLVASRFINIGQQINSNVVTVKRIEISNTMDYQLRPEALSSEILAKKAFRENEAIDKRFVKLRPDVLRNSTVTVLFNSSNLTIETESIALSDGIKGDSICVMNKIYNKVYTGKIIGENKVLVKI